MPLTPKQLAFCEYYIENPNAADAARRAGYSEKSARITGCELLTNPNISAYIKGRMEENHQKRVANADEVIEFFSSVMRGEVKDAFGLDPALSDRINAGKELMKRWQAAGYDVGTKQQEDDPLTKALKEEAARMDEENAD